MPSKHDRRWMNRLKMLVGAAGLISLAGCSNTLESGYAPRPLGVSSTERRGYYASPFTPEAAAAQASKSDVAADANSYRRPGGPP